MIDATEFLESSKLGYIDEVEEILLLDRTLLNSSDINGFTALSLAADYGHELIVHALLNQEGIEIDEIDKWGNTALIAAANRGYDDIVQALIENNANINARNHSRCDSALTLAACKGHQAIVARLLHSKADANSQNHYGSTALTSAVEKNNENIVRLLLTNNAATDVNYADNEADTALIIAAKAGLMNMMDILLSETGGIDVDVKNNIGRNCLYYAEERFGRDRALRSFNFSMRKNFLGLTAALFHGLQAAGARAKPGVSRGTDRKNKRDRSKSRSSVRTAGTTVAAVGAASKEGTRTMPLPVGLRSMVRCMEDCYWVRSMLEFIYFYQHEERLN